MGSNNCVCEAKHTAVPSEDGSGQESGIVVECPDSGFTVTGPDDAAESEAKRIVGRQGCDITWDDNGDD